MATINASVWLLIKELADPQRVFDQYVTVYKDNERSRFAWLLLFYSVQAGHLELVRQILESEQGLCEKLGVTSREALLESQRVTTVLNEAVRKNNAEMVELIVSVHPELVGQPGYVFSNNPHFLLESTPLELAIHEDNVDPLKMLVQHYNWKPLGYERRTLLHFAARYTAPKCTAYLLSIEACKEQINFIDEEGLTPLLCAAMYQPRTIPMLLESGADVNSQYEDNNVLQLLCNGTMTPAPNRMTEADPCPSVQFQRRPRPIFMRTDELYMTSIFVEISKCLIDKGLNVNAPTAPLQKFCHNIRRKLQDLLGDANETGIYKNVISYLASVSNRDVLDSSLLLLGHQFQFVCTQLRRSSDYDNIVLHVDLMEIIRDCIFILLENGADPNAIENVQEPVKRIRSLQYNIPFNVPCAVHLKATLETECKKLQSVKENQTTALDIILVALLVFYPVQIEEPEIHARGLSIILETFEKLSKEGGKCYQLIQIFLIVCVDPAKNMKFLDEYLEYQSQSDYHDIVTHLLQLCRSNEAFAEIQNQLSPYLVRMFSLKDLLRRDIISFLGSGKCPEKIASLPLPTTLKTYLMDFWESTQQ